MLSACHIMPENAQREIERFAADKLTGSVSLNFLNGRLHNCNSTAHIQTPAVYCASCGCARKADERGWHVIHRDAFCAQCAPRQKKSATAP